MVLLTDQEVLWSPVESGVLELVLNSCGPHRLVHRMFEFAWRRLEIRSLIGCLPASAWPGISSARGGPVVIDSYRNMQKLQNTKGTL